MAKSIYKKWWLWLIIVIIIAFIVSRIGGGSTESKPAETITVAEVIEELATAPTQEEINAVFDPKDVSDATIKSMSTYEDYLMMYWIIDDDHFAQYEAVIKDTDLYDEESFEEFKKSHDEVYERQNATYDHMRKTPIHGKTELVDYLIGYRDMLKANVDAVAESLNILN